MASNSSSVACWVDRFRNYVLLLSFWNFCPASVSASPGQGCDPNVCPDESSIAHAEWLADQFIVYGNAPGGKECLRALSACEGATWGLILAQALDAESKANNLYNPEVVAISLREHAKGVNAALALGARHQLRTMGKVDESLVEELKRSARSGNTHSMDFLTELQSKNADEVLAAASLHFARCQSYSKDLDKAVPSCRDFFDLIGEDEPMQRRAMDLARLRYPNFFRINSED